MTIGGACDRIMESMSAHVDGELPEAECREIERHLPLCEECARYLATLRTTVEECRRAPRPCMGEDCLQRAVAAARAELQRRGLIRA